MIGRHWTKELLTLVPVMAQSQLFSNNFSTNSMWSKLPGLNSFFPNLTQIFRVMEWRLSQRGFHLIPMEKWRSSGPYNLISALNLLDRHHDPNQLLDDLHFLATESNCPVLLSIVLPINQFVEFNPSDQAETRPKSIDKIIFDLFSMNLRIIDIGNRWPLI